MTDHDDNAAPSPIRPASAVSDAATSGPMVPLDDHVCWSRLAAGAVGRLAVDDEVGPVIFPVNYVLDGRTIVFRTAPGTKLAAATHDRPASFEIDEIHPRQHTGWSVVVRGTVHEIVDETELERARRLRPSPFAAATRQRFIRVVPHQVTGYEIAVPAERGREPEHAPDIGNVWHGRDASDLLG